MKWTIPRKPTRGSPHVSKFSIKSPAYTGYWGWILEPERGVSSSSENMSWTGNSMQCICCDPSGPLWLPCWVANQLCEFNYSYDADYPYITYHIGLIWQPDSDNYPEPNGDSFKFRWFGWKDTWYYAYVYEECGSEPNPPCECRYKCLTECTDVKPLNFVGLNLGTDDYQTKPMTEQNVDLKWFRDLWNSVVPIDQQVAADESCPIEPTSEEFKFWYVYFREGEISVSYVDTGWCQPWGGYCEQENCSTRPTCPANKSKLSDANQVIGPSVSYPFEILRNNGIIAYYPPEFNLYKFP